MIALNPNRRRRSTRFTQKKKKMPTGCIAAGFYSFRGGGGTAGGGRRASVGLRRLCRLRLLAAGWDHGVPCPPVHARIVGRPLLAKAPPQLRKLLARIHVVDHLRTARRARVQGASTHHDSVMDAFSCAQSIPGTPLPSACPALRVPGHAPCWCRRPASRPTPARCRPWPSRGRSRRAPTSAERAPPPASSRSSCPRRPPVPRVCVRVCACVWACVSVGSARVCTRLRRVCVRAWMGFMHCSPLHGTT